MTDEFDERLPHSLTEDAVRCYYVGHAEYRKQKTDPYDLQRLKNHVLSTESRQSLVPDGSQKLLHVRMGDELRGEINFDISEAKVENDSAESEKNERRGRVKRKKNTDSDSTRILLQSNGVPPLDASLHRSRSLFFDFTRFPLVRIANPALYLLLSQFNGQLETIQVHPLAVLEGRPRGIVVQQYFQLV